MAIAERSLDIPNAGKCRWLMVILGLEPGEMELALDVDRSTLRRWLDDPRGRAASRDVKFDRLLRLTQAARGSIRPERLGDWMRRPNPRMGGLTPARVLGDDAGFAMVEQALLEARSGSPL